MVIIISGLLFVGDVFKELVSVLKWCCGIGGSFKDGVVEIQGEYVELLIDEFFKCGFKVKKFGG